MKTKQFIVVVVALFMAMPAIAEGPSYQHWSLNLNGGVTTMFPTRNSFFGNMGPTFGLDLEWTATPLWGLSLDYQYSGFYTKKAYGHINDIALSAQVNVMNLLWKYRSGNWQKLNAYGHLGAGVSFAANQRGENHLCGVMPAGIMLEYNITPLLALNLDFGGRVFTNSYRDGLYRRALISTTAGIRIKFGTSNHIRNTTYKDYEATFQAPSVDVEAFKKLQKEVDNTNTNLKKDESTIDNNKREIDALKKEIDDLKKQMAAKPAEAPVATNNYSQTVTFDFAMAVLKPAFHPYLDDVATELIKTNDQVAVVGHADNVGSNARNMKISVDRANVVANYLIKKGVDRKQLNVKGMGATQPVADNKTKEGRAQNRRVGFIKQ